MAIRFTIVQSVLSAALLTLAGMLAGCLERFEAITIAPDGGAQLRSRFRGTPEDFKKPADALPEQGGAWAVTQSEEKGTDGKVTVVRVAEFAAAPGATLPGTYAPAGDPRESSSLRFPTKLHVSHLAGRTYYDLVRTYQHRDEARYTYLRNKLADADAIKKIDGKDPSTLTDEERTALLRMFARVEADKQAQFVRTGAAALEADGTWPQEIGLTLRSAALDYGERFNVSEAAAILARPDSPERGEALKPIAGAFIDGLHRTVLDALKGMGVTDERRERFGAAAKREQANRQATEDLADERWEVRVTMPGTLAAHNADRVENGVLVWEFDAKAIMDRDHEVRATSWVADAPGTK